MADSAQTSLGKKLQCLLESGDDNWFWVGRSLATPMAKRYGAFLSVDDIDDIVQIALFRLWRGWQDKQARGEQFDNCSGYLSRIVRNTCIDRLRSNHRKTEALPSEEDENGDPLYSIADTSIDANPARVVEEREAYEELKKLIEHLPDTYRETCRLYFLMEMTPQQVAVKLDTPLETVRSQIKRGKAKLRPLVHLSLLNR